MCETKPPGGHGLTCHRDTHRKGRGRPCLTPAEGSSEKLDGRLEVSQVEAQSWFGLRTPAPGGPGGSFLGLLPVPIPCEPASEEIRHKYLCQPCGRTDGRLEVLGVLPDTAAGPSPSKRPVGRRGSFGQSNVLWTRASEAPRGSEVQGGRPGQLWLPLVCKGRAAWITGRDISEHTLGSVQSTLHELAERLTLLFTYLQLRMLKQQDCRLSGKGTTSPKESTYNWGSSGDT